MQEDRQHIDINLITRYLTGEINPDEREKVEEWINVSEENCILFDEYQKTWDSLGQISGIASIDVESEWKIFEQQIDSKTHSVSMTGRLLRYSYRIAAILLIGLITAFGIRYLFTHTGTSRQITQIQTKELRLPDGSRVTLNKMSEIRYPKKFNTEERSVFLTGEAYFEVVSRKDQAFIINTGKIRIEVLGTSFNVRAYEDTEEIEIIVDEGTVSVNKNGRVEEKIILKAGNKGIYNKNSEAMKLSLNQDRNFLSWKTRKFVFEDTPLIEIVAQLNEFYQSEIIIPDDSLRQSRITVSFDNQSLEAVVNVLQATLDLKHTRSGKRIELSEKDE